MLVKQQQGKSFFTFFFLFCKDKEPDLTASFWGVLKVHNRPVTLEYNNNSHNNSGYDTPEWREHIRQCDAAGREY